MSDMIEIIRCRECKHAKHRDDVEQGKLACMVREGLGGFIVPEDGFCHLAEERSDDGKCGDCKHYREHKHDHFGDRFDGVCCKSERIAFSTMSGNQACRVFEKR